jgi:hypothetical protein
MVLLRQIVSTQLFNSQQRLVTFPEYVNTEKRYTMLERFLFEVRQRGSGFSLVRRTILLYGRRSRSESSDKGKGQGRRCASNWLQQR